MIAHLIAATVTGLIALAATFAPRRGSAGLRHTILLAGLLGFAVPTPWLIRAGDKLATRVAPPASPSFVMFEYLLTRVPLLSTPALRPPSRPESQIFGDALWPLWAVVAAILLASYIRRCLRTIPAVREANPAELDALNRAKLSLSLARNILLRIASSDRVPGARGWRRPSVVLPDGLSDELSESELQAIVAHELAHIARHDNLSAALARGIVSVFWFHPLVWWMERRLLAEREAACDERVLAHGTEPADYASAILKVCRMSFADSAAGSAGYAGATGSDLKNRMEQIMSIHAVRPPSHLLRALPGAVLMLAAAVPLSEGFLRAQTPARVTTHHANDAAIQKAYDSWKQGRFQEAEQLFRQIYVEDPEDPRAAAGLADTYVSENRPQDAVEFLKVQSAEHPSRTYLRQLLGNVYVRIEQYDLAMSEFQSILDSQQNPSPEEKSRLLFQIAEANRRKGDLNEALRWFRASAAANPKDAHPLLAAALILDGTGRSQQASSVYEQVLKLQPDQPVALNNLSYLVAEQGADPDRALSLALRAAQANKTSPDIEDTLGWAYLQKNQPDQAIGAFRAALQARPNDAGFHYHLGLALLPVGEREAAIRELKTALADDPQPQDAAKINELLQKIAP